MGENEPLVPLDAEPYAVEWLKAFHRRRELGVSLIRLLGDATARARNQRELHPARTRSYWRWIVGTALLELAAAAAGWTLIPRSAVLALAGITIGWMVLVAIGGALHIGLVRTPDDRPREKFGLANGITLARIASVPLMAFWIAFLAPGRPVALFCFLLLLAVTLSDILDGNIARHLDAPTRFGRRADQAADLVVGSVVATALFTKGLLPWWFAGAVLFRYFGAGLGAALLSLRKGQPTPAAPTVLGKASTLTLALGVLAVVAEQAWPDLLPRGLLKPLLGAGTALALVSAADLMKRAYEWFTASAADGGR